MNLTMNQVHYMHDYKLDYMCGFLPGEFLSTYAQAHFIQYLPRFGTLEELFDIY